MWVYSTGHKIEIGPELAGGGEGLVYKGSDGARDAGEDLFGTRGAPALRET